ncbi:hypothetical protein SAMN04487820_105200 [Actinopolyspora mzabensis]|uniref:DUF4145 domain-containing protein n=1 Tax=Actinopolyspora mzabensis TaxID=995066 RepID=A0A1G8ZZ89_ACTMZ|nr:hypothetical protein SAMN04487820_105200 [Actinopolyspora mzabensis]
MTANTSDADRLITSAHAVLDRTIAVPPHQVSRVAAFLARRALEAITRDLCERVGVRSDIATMRARLVVLRHHTNATTAELLARSWLGLSRACHHHAFEFAPNENEVRRLLEHVKSTRPRDEHL